LKLLKETQKQLTTHFRNFLTKNFPVPEEGLDGPMDSHLEGRQKYWGMREIIKELMMRRTKHPDDPYVQIADYHWPPYINLLIRSKVVAVDDRDSHFIKLVDFDK